MIRTHGQIAYEAFWQTFATAVGADIDPWDSIHRATQQAWEAAAQAVLDFATEAEARAALAAQESKP